MNYGKCRFAKYISSRASHDTAAVKIFLGLSGHVARRRTNSGETQETEKHPAHTPHRVATGQSTSQTNHHII